MGAEARATAAAKSAAEQAADAHIKNAPRPSQHQLIDAYGHPLAIGATYGFSSPLPIPAVIVDIRNNFSGGVPAGSYIVTLMAQIVLQAMSRSPIRPLIYIGGLEEALAKAEGRELPTDESTQQHPQAPSDNPEPQAPSGIILTGI